MLMSRFKFFLIFCLLFCAKVNATQTLSALTFNVWMVKKAGISISSRLEQERLPLIVNNIKKLNPDIVALQEVWDFSLRDEFVKNLRDQYPYHFHRNYRVGMGDGMILFSKYPFLKEPSQDHTFNDGTAIEEWHILYGLGVQKGIFRVGINANGAPIDVFVFHLGAVYFEGEDYNSAQVAGREGQFKEMRTFVENTLHQDRPAILMGDLNTHFFKWDPRLRQRQRELVPEYDGIVRGLGFSDSFTEANGISLQLDSMHDLELYSFDTQKNLYAGKGVFSNLPPEFTDYIFYKPSSNSVLRPLFSRLVFNTQITREELEASGFYHRHPDLFFVNPRDLPSEIPLFLSDHWGLYTEFNLSP